MTKQEGPKSPAQVKQELLEEMERVDTPVERACLEILLAGVGPLSGVEVRIP